MKYSMGLAFDRCTVTGQSLTGSALVRFQTAYIFDQENKSGLTFTEFLTVEGNYDAGPTYALAKKAEISQSKLQTAALSEAKHAVVNVVDAMEAKGFDGRATFDVGTRYEMNFHDREDFMAHLSTMTQNKSLIMEIRQMLFDEKLSTAYDSWGAW